LLMAQSKASGEEHEDRQPLIGDAAPGLQVA